MNETIIGMDATLEQFEKIAAAFPVFRLAVSQTEDRPLNWTPCIQIGETLWKSHAIGD